MRFIALGGAGKIGASCYVLELESQKRIVIDCGMGQEEQFLVHPPRLDYLDGVRVDAFLFTHSHLDHVGAGPLAARLHPEARVIATPPTWYVSALMLEDAISVAERTWTEPLFSREDLYNFLEKMEVDNPPLKKFQVGEFEVQFWPSGHIRGAASVLVNSPEGQVVFSGDISFSQTPTVEGAWELPQEFQRPEVLVLESTYGDEILPARKELEATLVQRVEEALRKGNVLVAAFANGRLQDIALLLAEAGIPVYIGGLGKKIFFSALENPENSWVSDKPIRRPGNLYFIKDLPHAVELATSRRRKGVIVAPSGWLQGGYARLFAQLWVDNPNNHIFLTGWQKTGLTGHRLLQAEEGELVPFDDEFFIKRARVELFHLSGHADQKELEGFVLRLQPKKVILVHGEHPAPEVLKERLRNKGINATVAKELVEINC